MKPINKYIASTAIFDFFIIIGAGHGIGTLGLVGILWLPNILTGEFELSFFGEYDESLGTSALLSIIGQVLFFIALIWKNKKNNQYLFYLVQH
ncbi:hypothetical protein [Echinicola sp. 20G]|uniref:hypothetical protein n=1 Tax=Echinicola sp. 20G TaxID=2781961 RepID=UPI001910BFE9|nr:hypothetical protein [Echinicola sp. 20G]